MEAVPAPRLGCLLPTFALVRFRASGSIGRGARQGPPLLRRKTVLALIHANAPSAHAPLSPAALSWAATFLCSTGRCRLMCHSVLSTSCSPAGALCSSYWAVWSWRWWGAKAKLVAMASEPGSKQSSSESLKVAKLFAGIYYLYKKYATYAKW